MKQIYTCLLLFLFSCTPSHQSINLDDETEIVPELFSDELVMPPPTQMRDLNSHIVFMTPNMGSCLLFLDKKTKEIFTWGRVGNGPDDFFQVSCVGQDGNKMKLYDTNLRKYAEYEVLSRDSIDLNRIESRQINSGNISLLNIHAMDNGAMVGFAGFGCDKMFVLLDKDFKVVKSFGEPPVEGFPEENFLQLYGTFASYQNKLFFASQPTGYIVCFDIDSQGSIVKNWDLFLTAPLYNSDSGKWEKENKWGFFDMQANEEYVFAAYSGKTVLDQERVPQNILVFTHEGKLIKNIRYKNEYIGRFTISKDRYIYTIGNDRLMVSNLENWGI